MRTLYLLLFCLPLTTKAETIDILIHRISAEGVGSPLGHVMVREGREGIELLPALNGLSPGPHGFHIHEAGDLREGCKSLCTHYNPSGKLHGGLRDEESHAGDLGNLHSDPHGKCNFSFSTNKFRVSVVKLCIKCINIYIFTVYGVLFLIYYIFLG